VIADGASAALRALGFVALFQAAGATLFIAGLGRSLTVTGPAIRRFGMHMAWLAAVLVALQFALEPVRMAGAWSGLREQSMWALALHSSRATACAARLLGLAMICAGLRTRRGHGLQIALAGTVFTLLGFVLVGHTAAHPQRFLVAPLLVLHLAVLAFWFGALWPLWQISRREPAAIAAGIVAGFSARALLLVPALFVAGAVIAALLLPDAAALQSRYGRLLLTKIGLFAVLMGLAALNRWRFGPRLAQGDAVAGRAFRATLLLESLLIIAALCATAVLTLLYSPENP
jgi:putative copper export protein